MKILRTNQKAAWAKSMCEQHTAIFFIDFSPPSQESLTSRSLLKGLLLWNTHKLNTNLAKGKSVFWVFFYLYILTYTIILLSGTVLRRISRFEGNNVCSISRWSSADNLITEMCSRKQLWNAVLRAFKYI